MRAPLDAATIYGVSEVPRMRARRDLFVIGIVILVACAVILVDPDRAFEWVASHEEVRVDEWLRKAIESK